MVVHDHARRVRFRLDVRIRLSLIQPPRVRDDRDRGRDHLEECEQENDPHQSRISSQAHREW